MTYSEYPGTQQALDDTEDATARQAYTFEIVDPSTITWWEDGRGLICVQDGDYHGHLDGEDFFHADVDSSGLIDAGVELRRRRGEWDAESEGAGTLGAEITDAHLRRLRDAKGYLDE